VHHAIQIALRVAVFGLVIGVIAHSWRQISSTELHRFDSTQVVSLLDDPQLPPPPEMEDLPKPEPEEALEAIEQTEEVDVPEGPQPLDDYLAIEGDASAGFDSFGLVAKRGGRDLLEVGSGSGDGLDWKLYGTVIEDGLRAALAEREDLRRRNYSIVVRIWIDVRGAISRAELTQSTGSTEVDEALEHALATVGVLAEPPPEGMPQPVRIRITTRGA
jgi:protein TonB